MAETVAVAVAVTETVAVTVAETKSVAETVAVAVAETESVAVAVTVGSVIPVVTEAVERRCLEGVEKVPPGIAGFQPAS